MLFCCNLHGSVSLITSRTTSIGSGGRRGWELPTPGNSFRLSITISSSHGIHPSSTRVAPRRNRLIIIFSGTEPHSPCTSLTLTLRVPPKYRFRGRISESKYTRAASNAETFKFCRPQVSNRRTSRSSSVVAAMHTSTYFAVRLDRSATRRLKETV